MLGVRSLVASVLCCLLASSTACSTGGSADSNEDYGPPIPGEGAGEGGVPPEDARPVYFDPSGLGAADPTALCSSTLSVHALQPADARRFTGATLALAEVRAGRWPDVAPGSAELLAYLGPRTGPASGRFVGRLTETRLDVAYLSPPASEPVHVIAVLDLGPSVRSEVPLLVSALETMAARVATSGLDDRISVVEWTDEAPVGVRLAAAANAQADVAAYTAGLRSRLQFGGNPPLSVVRDPVVTLAAEAPAPAHVLLFTDGSMGARDSASLETAAAWREAGIPITLVEVQAFEPGENAVAIASHPLLLADRDLSDASLYVAAAVSGDPTRPPERSIDAAYAADLAYLFGDRFDDLVRPARVRARFDVSAPLELGLVPFESATKDEGQLGLRRLGPGGALIAQATVTIPACGAFSGRVELFGSVDGAEASTLAGSDTVFDAATGVPAYGALIAAIDAIDVAISQRSCGPEGSGIGAAFAELSISDTAGLEPAEAAAFEINRLRALDALEAVKKLCP